VQTNPGTNESCVRNKSVPVRKKKRSTEPEKLRRKEGSLKKRKWNNAESHASRRASKTHHSALERFIDHLPEGKEANISMLDPGRERRSRRLESKLKIQMVIVLPLTQPKVCPGGQTT